MNRTTLSVAILTPLTAFFLMYIETAIFGLATVHFQQLVIPNIVFSAVVSFVASKLYFVLRDKILYP